MKGLPFVLVFTAMTFLSWGAYGPVLHHGAVALDHDSMRAFVGVGLAYFLIAVLIPFLVLRRTGEKGKWTISGTIYSVVAGAVGAIGALGIILALGYGGRTLYVMPLVFGFAPVVNTLVTAWIGGTFGQIRPVFLGGILAAALGAGGVLFFKPSPAAAPGTAGKVDAAGVQAETEVDSSQDGQSQDGKVGGSPADDRNGQAVGLVESDETAVEESSDSPGASATGAKPVNVPGVIISIVIAALCWGSYGPMLHIGQGKMQGSRLRPFACVGLAYFFIAVAVPLFLIYSRTEVRGEWDVLGMTLSFLAGVAGAVGALGVILAFNAGGKPYYVMPLIFGFAPVVNTFITVSEAGTWSQVSIMFWVSLGVVIAGAVTVLINAPKPSPRPEPPPEPASETVLR